MKTSNILFDNNKKYVHIMHTWTNTAAASFLYISYHKSQLKGSWFLRPFNARCFSKDFLYTRKKQWEKVRKECKLRVPICAWRNSQNRPLRINRTEYENIYPSTWKNKAIFRRRFFQTLIFPADDIFSYFRNIYVRNNSRMLL